MALFGRNRGLPSRVNHAAFHAGIIDQDDPAYQRLPEYAEGERLIDIATGALVRLDEHLEECLATLRNKAKTVDMKRSTIKEFCGRFRYVSDVQRREVQRWLNEMLSEGKNVTTARRALSVKLDLMQPGVALGGAVDQLGGLRLDLVRRLCRSGAGGRIQAAVQVERSMAATGGADRVIRHRRENGGPPPLVQAHLTWS
jgi:hypothetical protein